MPSVLTPPIVVIGAGLLVNLALTFILIHQVRRYGEQIARRGPQRTEPTGLAVGSQIPGFAVRTVDGGTRSLSDLAGARSVIAFLSPGCLMCEWQLPEFKGYAQAIPGGASQALAVVCGAEDAAGDLVRELEGTASVAVEPVRGPAQAAFSVSGFPTFYVLDGSGRVEAGGPLMRTMTQNQPV
jgi:hypothetical protein